MGRKRSPARHDYDLVVRGACVYDGSDAPGAVVDVGVRDGCIVAVGTVEGSAGETVDGNDVEAVNEVVQRAVDRARAGGGPSFIDRSTARTCLVNAPMEMKSTSLAKRSAISATAGTSTMMPNGTAGAFRALRTSLQIAFSASTSLHWLIIGNMMASGPCATAR